MNDRMNDMPPSTAEWMGEMREAIDEPDPALSNRKITRIHYRLGQALQRATGGSEAGANFHSWAVWGSRKAGVTIRQEDLDSAIRDAFVVAGTVGATVGFAASRFAIRRGVRRFPADIPIAVLIGAGLGAVAGRAIAVHSRREASRLILAGNQTVLEDIGSQTIRFLETFAAQLAPNEDRLAAFQSGFRPGDTEDGGQDILCHAFTEYYRARYASTLKERHEALYFGNCLAVLHEHIRLQPNIRDSMPFIIRKCVTKRMMTFEVGNRRLAVSENLQGDQGDEFPATLQVLDAPALQMFLYGPTGWERDASIMRGSGATDWTSITERMQYIVRLFRAFHLDPAVSIAP